MNQRAWIVGAVVLIVAVAGTAVLVRSYRHAPLQQASSRTCMGCLTVFWNGVARIRAERLSGDYVFAEDASYLVSFREGAVAIANQPLAPGCHVGDAKEGDSLEIDGGRGLRLRVPAPEDGCSARGDGGD